MTVKQLKLDIACGDESYLPLLEILTPSEKVLDENVNLMKLLKDSQIEYLLCQRASRMSVKWENKQIDIDEAIEKETVLRLVETCFKSPNFLPESQKKAAAWKVKVMDSNGKLSPIIPHRLIIENVMKQYNSKLFVLFENKM